MQPISSAPINSARKREGIDRVCLSHLQHRQHLTSQPLLASQSTNIHQPALEGSSNRAPQRRSALPPGPLQRKPRLTRPRRLQRPGKQMLRCLSHPGLRHQPRSVASPLQHVKRPASALRTRARMPGSERGEPPGAACGSRWAGSSWPLGSSLGFSSCSPINPPPAQAAPTQALRLTPRSCKP